MNNDLTVEQLLMIKEKVIGQADKLMPALEESVGANDPALALFKSALEDLRADVDRQLALITRH